MNLIKSKKASILMLVLGFSFILGFYGFYLPNYIEGESSKQEEVIEISGMKPIEQTEVSGWESKATWKVIKTDSTGKPVEKLVDLFLDRGNWIIQPHQ